MFIIVDIYLMKSKINVLVIYLPNKYFFSRNKKNDHLEIAVK